MYCGINNNIFSTVNVNKNLKVTISVQIVMLIFALVIILMLSPVDNINNKMNYEEKNYLKKKIRVILIIELFLYAIFIVLSKRTTD